jgi:hypothetical protein
MSALERKVLAAGALGLLLLSQPAARAGQKSEATVNVGGFAASGAQGSARNTTDTQQYIGCTLSAWNSSAPEGTCYAQNSAGTGLHCYTVKESHLKLIAAMGPDSLINFSADINGYCSNLEIKTSSIYPPKKP